jgi:ATP-dependent RNA helicase DeaD
MDATGARIQRAEVPTVAEMEARDREVLSERLLTTLSGGSWGGYRELVEELAEEHDPVDLAAAALALAAGPRRELVEIPQVTELPARGPRRAEGRDQRARPGRPGDRNAPGRPRWGPRAAPGARTEPPRRGDGAAPYSRRPGGSPRSRTRRPGG